MGKGVGQICNQPISSMRRNVNKVAKEQTWEIHAHHAKRISHYDIPNNVMDELEVHILRTLSSNMEVDGG